MNASERADIRASLKAEIVELQEKITSLSANSGPVQPDKAIGRLTRLDEMQSNKVHQAALNGARERLSKLKYQLATVGTPLYSAD